MRYSLDVSESGGSGVVVSLSLTMEKSLTKLELKLGVLFCREKGCTGSFLLAIVQ